MRLTFVVLLISLGLATSAHAEKRFQLVGFTTSTSTGGVGVLGFTQACQAQFEASRMCTSSEVIGTVKLPAALPEGSAWVHPDFRPVATGTSSVTTTLDASGLESPGGDAQRLSCIGWSANGGGGYGLAVTSSGRFRAEPCQTTQPVACCALILVPEPPLSLIEPTAAASLASVLLARSVCGG